MERKKVTVPDILLMKKKGRKITKLNWYIENLQDDPVRIPTKINQPDPKAPQWGFICFGKCGLHKE